LLSRLRTGARRPLANSLRHQFVEYAMHTLLYYLIVLVLGAVLVVQLRSGRAGWEWWDKRTTYRDQYPGGYWAMMIIQLVLFIYFVLHGKQMPY
jgi:hypothetical protein